MSIEDDVITILPTFIPRKGLCAVVPTSWDKCRVEYYYNGRDYGKGDEKCYAIFEKDVNLTIVRIPSRQIESTTIRLKKPF
jgi:hypothetical protein